VIVSQDLLCPARDGTPLRATLVEPPQATHAVIVSGATAVPRGYYRAFAGYLAERGAAVLTYDYRGSGEPPAVLRASTARMRDWGDLDFSGTVAWMLERYPALPLGVVGHSFGGHALCMAPNNDRVERSVLVTSHSGYWGYFTPLERWRVRLLLAGIGPLTTSALGYLASKRIGFGEDLARGIFDDWRRWCGSPNYFDDDPTMAPILAREPSYCAPTLLLGMSDDPWGTRGAIDWLARRFTAAPVEVRILDPRAFSLAEIGHMGFFRMRNGPALWPIAAHHLGLMEVAA